MLHQLLFVEQPGLDSKTQSVHSVAKHGDPPRAKPSLLKNHSEFLKFHVCERKSL